MTSYNEYANTVLQSEKALREYTSTKKVKIITGRPIKLYDTKNKHESTLNVDSECLDQCAYCEELDTVYSVSNGLQVIHLCSECFTKLSENKNNNTFDNLYHKHSFPAKPF